jgi:hypothetical protein
LLVCITIYYTVNGSQTTSWGFAAKDKKPPKDDLDKPKKTPKDDLEKTKKPPKDDLEKTTKPKPPPGDKPKPPPGPKPKPPPGGKPKPPPGPKPKPPPGGKPKPPPGGKPKPPPGGPPGGKPKPPPGGKPKPPPGGKPKPPGGKPPFKPKPPPGGKPPFKPKPFGPKPWDKPKPFGPKPWDRPWVRPKYWDKPFLDRPRPWADWKGGYIPRHSYWGDGRRPDYWWRPRPEIINYIGLQPLSVYELYDYINIDGAFQYALPLFVNNPIVLQQQDQFVVYDDIQKIYNWLRTNQPPVSDVNVISQWMAQFIQSNMSSLNNIGRLVGNNNQPWVALMINDFVTSDLGDSNSVWVDYIYMQQLLQQVYQSIPGVNYANPLFNVYVY